MLILYCLDCVHGKDTSFGNSAFLIIAILSERSSLSQSYYEEDSSVEHFILIWLMYTNEMQAWWKRKFYFPSHWELSGNFILLLMP